MKSKNSLALWLMLASAAIVSSLIIILISCANSEPKEIDSKAYLINKGMKIETVEGIIDAPYEYGVYIDFNYYVELKQ